VATDLYIDEATRVMSLEMLKRMFLQNGSTRLFYKSLAPNDNSKNQVYVGGTVEDTRPIPTPVGAWKQVLGKSRKGDSVRTRYILQATVNFGWLKPDGSVCRAHHTKMILYPQYNNDQGEFRLSGFLQGATARPSSLLNADQRGRERGRVMFFGTDDMGKVLSFMAPGDSRIARELAISISLERVGVLDEIPLNPTMSPVATRAELLLALGTVHKLGWADSKLLNARTGLRPCHGPQCIGQTLLAELRVPADGRAAPDYRGWEVKAYTVKSFASRASCRVTLMTPQPTGGHYVEYGVAEFLTRYGSASASDPGKRYFEGQHRVGIANQKRGTTLTVVGYDQQKHTISDASGGIRLLDVQGNIAAEWGFAGLVEHWRNKHARAVFVPGRSEQGPPQRYWYSPTVHLATGNPFALFIEALINGSVIYDPGVRLGKARSQFRTTVPNCLSKLYENVELNVAAT
jgi:MvaI/BcnI restriction endonuclease family